MPRLQSLDMGDPVQQLRSLVVQSAETSRLLGVDFMPVYHSGVLGIDVPLESEVPPTAQPLAAPAVPQTPAPITPPAASPSPALSKPSLPPSKLASPAVGPSRQSAPASNPPEPQLVTPGSGGWKPLKDFERVSGEQAAGRPLAQREQAMQGLLARYEKDAPHQHFVTDHHSIVWGEGDLCARLMFIGEAPGEEEDRTGRPFVGKAGQLLDKMIAGMGLRREQVYIANVLKTRPPGNATPTEQEASLCAPYLIEQVAIVGPEVIVTLGLPATRLILQSMATMGSMRGIWANFALPDGRAIAVMPTYHPAYVLRSYTEEVRGKVWSDLKMVKARLGLA